jgi:hypothetical protein
VSQKSLKVSKKKLNATLKSFQDSNEAKQKSRNTLINPWLTVKPLKVLQVRKTSSLSHMETPSPLGKEEEMRMNLQKLLTDSWSHSILSDPLEKL